MSYTLLLYLRNSLIVLSIAVVFPLRAQILPSAPQVNGKAHLLMDFQSGQVLVENNPDMRVEPASLTKIMTDYVIASELKEGSITLEDEVLVSEKAWKMGGSQTFIEAGKKVKLKDLLIGMIVQSGNDATVALAEHVGGSEDVFVSMMNQKAQQLGMKNTHFMNSTGMPDPNHYTTANDMAVLTVALIKDFPETYAYSKIKEFTFNNIVQQNRNLLLWRDGSVDGVKTGHTDSAGYCLVASALREHMRLISIIFASASEQSRATSTQALLNYGYRFFETHLLYKANKPVTAARIWKGAADKVALGFLDDLFITVPRNRYKDLKASIKLGKKAIAPVQAGQSFGTLSITLEGKELISKPLVALNNVPKGSMLRGLVDELRLIFE